MNAEAAGAEAAKTVFRLENITVKNLSLEIPTAVVSPAFKQEPVVKMELRNAARGLNRENYYEVTLEVTLRLFSGEELQLLLETSQAGVVFLQNADAKLREEILNINAPEMLYPYISQLVGDLLMRAGAPRLFLPPFNFRALYAKKREAAEKKIAADAASPKPS